MTHDDRTTESLKIYCRNLPAPYPLLGARAAIRKMNDGDVLGLLVTDRDTIADLPAWCRMTGNRLLAAADRRGIYCAVIRKGNEARTP